MKNIKLTVAYDGTNYHGYQLQENAVTVQEKIENALNNVYRPEQIRAYSASRTDSGVHAKAQTINYFTNKNIPVKKIPVALNTNLPNDIVVADAQEVSLDFRSRRDAKKKKYCYYIYHSQFMNPFWRNYALHLRGDIIDIKKMKRAARSLIGTHDFYPFQAIQGTDPDIDTIKEIFSCEINDTEHPLIVFEIIGSGFLYKMVRIIVGTLLEIGKGRLDETIIDSIIRNQDRSLVGPTAKPHGLFLEKIWYA
ncbi:tRNA pseudouridine(38-40) synthase TruA [Natranaerobius trueperi]|uniref:tRNA pseudouridine synthase A n=1 Tax=Natranaerobius trueperi TaxID=759412 RepID=A0A226C216_9FIRM|nr:tRNA pseudouridine(38-40) synthase TruA [Natranaerobius trueperi]OWZ84457.1 tRNA pseudouridine(38-40) synthase TruA [Natranaerobius trueperi]